MPWMQFLLKILQLFVSHLFPFIVLFVLFIDNFIQYLIRVVFVGHLLIEMELENLLLDFVFDVSALLQCERFLPLLLHDFILEGIDADSGQEDFSIALIFLFLSIWSSISSHRKFLSAFL